MKKYLSIFFILIIFTLLILGLSFNKIEKDKNNDVNPALAIMIQNDNEDYVRYNKESWPIDKYVYSKSNCNGESEITWNSSSDTIVLNNNKSKNCTIYFDHMPLADYIKSLYTGDGENNIYYFDGSGSYENSTLETNDNSYRYAGSNDEVKNYVCFGSKDEKCPDENLYRIIGIFDDDNDGTYETKLIKATYASSTLLGTETDGSNGTYTSNNSYYYQNYWKDGAETNLKAYWPTAQINTTHLNKNFYNKFNDQYKKLIANHKWYYNGITWGFFRNSNNLPNARTLFENEIKNQTIAANDYIGLMYISDYLYAANPKHWNKPPYNGDHTLQGAADDKIPDYRKATSDNWMYSRNTEWTMTQITETDSFQGFSVFFIELTGFVNNWAVGTSARTVRPVFYLNEKAKILGGSGAKEDPYRVG